MQLGNLVGVFNGCSLYLLVKTSDRCSLWVTNTSFVVVLVYGNLPNAEISIGTICWDGIWCSYETMWHHFAEIRNIYSNKPYWEIPCETAFALSIHFVTSNMMKLEDHYSVWIIWWRTCCCYSSLPCFGVYKLYFRVLPLILDCFVPYLNKALEMVSFSLQIHISYHKHILIVCWSSAGKVEDAVSWMLYSDCFQCGDYCSTTCPLTHLKTTQVLFVKQGSKNSFCIVLSPRILSKWRIELLVIWTVELSCWKRCRLEHV